MSYPSTNHELPLPGGKVTIDRNDRRGEDATITEDPGALCMETAASLSKLFHAVIRVILSRVCIDVPQFSDVAIQPIYSIPSTFHNGSPGDPIAASLDAGMQTVPAQRGLFSLLLTNLSSNNTLEPRNNFTLFNHRIVAFDALARSKDIKQQYSIPLKSI